MRFHAWPELKEAHISGLTPATFMLAPLAMALRQQGVPVKIVYLGHRDGSALMVRRDSTIYDFKDLKGKRVAIPNRFSNQYLLIFKALKDRGMTLKDLEIVEMPPPDMPAALYAKAVDAVISASLSWRRPSSTATAACSTQAKELWPNFISCVMVANESFIKQHPDKVQDLVTGIARSGLWLDAGMDHRMKAAEAVATQYYNQDPRLLRFVLSKPPDRVTYTNLRMAKKEFEYIADLALEPASSRSRSPTRSMRTPVFRRTPPASVLMPGRGNESQAGVRAVAAGGGRRIRDGLAFRRQGVGERHLPHAAPGARRHLGAGPARRALQVRRGLAVPGGDRLSAGRVHRHPIGAADGLVLSRVRMALNPAIQVLRPISPIAWIPVAILWFGVSDAAPIFLIFLASLFPITVAAMAAVQNIQLVYIRAARNFGIGGLALFQKVVLPAALPQILTGLRLALGVAWLVVVAAEMIAVNSGLGYLIIDARNAGKRYDLVVAGMAMIGLIGLGSTSWCAAWRGWTRFAGA